MKPLNKKSQLYKLNMEYGTREFSAQSRYYNKISLCTLVSSTVIVFIKGLVFMCLALYFIGAVLSPILLLSGWTPSFVDVILLYPLLIVILVFTVLAGGTMYYLEVLPLAPEYMKIKRKPKYSEKVKYSFRDYYVYAYIKALKDKVCPIIDIVED
jgi:hypothetical protein